MRVMVRDFRRYEKNTLKAFCTLEILDLHLIIKDCTVHQKNGRAWVGFPGKKFKNREGEEAWTNLLEFADDDAKEEFRKAAVASIRKHVETENAQDARPKDDSDEPPF